MNVEQLKESIWEFLETQLNLGPSNLVGIDIGTSSLRICEMEELSGGKYRLNKFAIQALSYGVIVENEIIRPEEIRNHITQMMENLKISNKNICLGISGPNCLAKRMQVPGDSPEEIANHIEWESEQYIPFGIEDAKISYFIQGQNEGGGNDCLMAAAKNDILESCSLLLEDCQLKLKVIDLDILALCNVYLASHHEKEIDPESGIILLDFGAQKTNLAIIQNDKILFTREINIGGKNVTEDIQKELSLSYEEAQDLKSSIDSEGHGPEEVLKIVQNCVAQIAQEIKKTIQFFSQTETDMHIGKALITGGACQLYNLKDYLQEDLDVPIEFFNPFLHFSINDKYINPDQLSQISLFGVVAIGLSLRKISKKQQ